MFKKGCSLKGGKACLKQNKVMAGETFADKAVVNLLLLVKFP